MIELIIVVSLLLMLFSGKLSTIINKKLKAKKEND